MFVKYDTILEPGFSGKTIVQCEDINTDLLDPRFIFAPVGPIFVFLTFCFLGMIQVNQMSDESGESVLVLNNRNQILDESEQ